MKMYGEHGACHVGRGAATCGPGFAKEICRIAGNAKTQTSIGFLPGAYRLGRDRLLLDHRCPLRAGPALEHGENPIDLANQYLPGTIVGIAGSALIAVIGLVLLSRKSV